VSWKEAAELTRLWASAADSAQVGRGVTKAQLHAFHERLQEWAATQDGGKELLYIWTTIRVAAGLWGLAETMLINSHDLDPTKPDATKPDGTAPPALLYPEDM
jgi:hypothetical protein